MILLTNVKSGWIQGMSYIATRFMSFIVSSVHFCLDDEFVGKSTNFISFLQENRRIIIL